MKNMGTKVPKTKCRGVETAKKAWAHPKGCARFSWGGRGRKFKSCHSDQKAFEFCAKCTDSEAFPYQIRPLFVTFTQSDRFCFEV